MGSKGHDVVYTLRIREQHYQPVDPQGDSRAGAKVFKACKKRLGHRIVDPLQPFFARDCGAKTDPLFDGVDQFAKAVGKFHTGPEELEPFGDLGISRFYAGKSRLGSRIVLQYARSWKSQVFLNL